MPPTTAPAPARRPSALRVYRQALGFSQEEAASQAGITREALGALERGQAQPRVSTATALSRVLGASIEDLFPAQVGDG
jgi:DNA-binding XRE family transcriptional regulator